MKNNKDKTLGIYVAVRDEGYGLSSDYRLAWVTAYIVQVKDASEAKFDFAGEYGELAAYSNIQLRELLSTARPQSDTGSLKAYEIASAYAGELEIIARTLKSLGRSFEKLAQKIGAPVTFGQNCLRLAAATGAQHVLTDRPEGYRGESRHLCSDLATGQFYIDRAIQAWREKWTPKPKPMASTLPCICDGTTDDQADVQCRRHPSVEVQS